MQMPIKLFINTLSSINFVIIYISTPFQIRLLYKNTFLMGYFCIFKNWLTNLIFILKDKDSRAYSYFDYKCSAQ